MAPKSRKAPINILFSGFVFWIKSCEVATGASEMESLLWSLVEWSKECPESGLQNTSPAYLCQVDSMPLLEERMRLLNLEVTVGQHNSSLYLFRATILPGAPRMEPRLESFPSGAIFVLRFPNVLTWTAAQQHWETLVATLGKQTGSMPYAGNVVGISTGLHFDFRLWMWTLPPVESDVICNRLAAFFNRIFGRRAVELSMYSVHALQLKARALRIPVVFLIDPSQMIPTAPPPPPLTAPPPPPPLYYANVSQPAMTVFNPYYPCRLLPSPPPPPSFVDFINTAVPPGVMGMAFPAAPAASSAPITPDVGPPFPATHVTPTTPTVAHPQSYPYERSPPNAALASRDPSPPSEVDRPSRRGPAAFHWRKVASRYMSSDFGSSLSVGPGSPMPAGSLPATGATAAAAGPTVAPLRVSPHQFQHHVHQHYHARVSSTGSYHSSAQPTPLMSPSAQRYSTPNLDYMHQYVMPENDGSEEEQDVTMDPCPVPVRRRGHIHYRQLSIASDLADSIAGTGALATSVHLQTDSGEPSSIGPVSTDPTVNAAVPAPHRKTHRGTRAGKKLLERRLLRDTLNTTAAAVAASENTKELSLGNSATVVDPPDICQREEKEARGTGEVPSLAATVGLGVTLPACAGTKDRAGALPAAATADGAAGGGVGEEAEEDSGDRADSPDSVVEYDNVNDEDDAPQWESN